MAREMKARNCALRANIAQCLRLSIRAVRPEAGPCLGLSRLHVEHQATTISTIFNHTRELWQGKSSCFFSAFNIMQYDFKTHGS
jgi:hypothetical protein